MSGRANDPLRDVPSEQSTRDIRQQRDTPRACSTTLLLAVLFVGCASAPSEDAGATTAVRGTGDSASAPADTALPEIDSSWVARVDLAAPLPEIPDWTAQVEGVQAATDLDVRRAAMIALVEQALDGTGLDVYAADTIHSDFAHPDDYRPVPAINFDIHLNDKRSRQFSPGASTHSLEDNGGYYFTDNLVPFVVLGPKLLDPRSPLFVRMYAEHELYHAANDVGDRRAGHLRELEAWTAGFIKWFHKAYEYGNRWGPLIYYYGESNPEARRRALDELVAYYKAPPMPPIRPGEVADVKAGFVEWLGNRRADPRMSSQPMLQALVDRLDLSEEEFAAAQDDTRGNPCAEPVALPPVPDIAGWASDVEAARAIDGTVQRRQTMAGLVRQAMNGSGLELHVVTSPASDDLDPADYRTAPTVNFDMHLSERLSDDRDAYYFSENGEPFVILGPGSLNTRGPVFIRWAAQHELCHARHHMGTPLPVYDRELEAWSSVFVHFFHEMYQHKMRWWPLIYFYERATPAARQAAHDLLVDYYLTPPSPPVEADQSSTVKKEFAAWLERRLDDSETQSQRLIVDLDEELDLQ